MVINANYTQNNLNKMEENIINTPEIENDETQIHLSYKIARRAELQETKDRLIARMLRQKRMAKLSFFLGAFLVIAMIAMYFFMEVSKTIYLMMTAYATLILSFPFITSNRESEIQVQQIQSELDLLELDDSSLEKRSEKLFKYHQLELKKYYDQTLRHSSWIFLTGLFCIIVGFAFVGATLYLIFNNKSIEFNEKILLASVGTLSTLLSNFIGAIYLKMYSETVKSLTEFHNRLVITHHLHFGNYLTSQISDVQLREKTLSEITLKIVDFKN